MKKIPELLCPAGDKESFYAAVNNGADAVYLGGKLFNARSSAGNFTDADFDEILDYAHLRGVKINLTLNTLYKQTEIKDVLNFAEKMYLKGVDAFIVQDIGIANELKLNFNDILLNASTQMSVHSLEAVKYFEENGFNRVVLSRELSLDEIKTITKNTKIQIETFVHGALCVSYSGQCLMSSLIGGRSGNRGKCAQPCRMNYSLLKEDEKIEEGYLLSPRDIMTLGVLEDLVDANISAFKIEGRMKNPEYVAIVTKAYREALDMIKAGNYIKDENAIKEVTQVFNRGGNSTTGYYYDFAGNEMMSNLTPKSTGLYLGKVIDYKGGYRSKCVIMLEDSVVAGDGLEIWTDSSSHAGTYANKAAEKGEILEVFLEGEIKRGDKVYKSFDKNISDKGKRLTKQSKNQLEIEGKFIGKIGKPIELILKYQDIIVTKTGDTSLKAENKPMTEEKISEQLQKTGATPYTIKFSAIDIDEDLFVNISGLNALRRDAIEAFEKEHLNSYKKTGSLKRKFENSFAYVGEKKLSCKVVNKEQFKSAIEEGINRIYYPLGDIEDMIELSKEAKTNNCEFYVYFTPIDRTEDEIKTKDFIIKAENTDIDGFLLSTYGQLKLAKELSKKHLVLDYTFNVLNSLSYDYFKKDNIALTLSMELNLKDMEKISGTDCEVIIHGNQVSMTTHQCPVGLYGADKKSGKYCKLRNDSSDYYLFDRKNEKFKIIRDCDRCVAFILNSQKLCMLNKITDVLNINAEYLRLNFISEDGESVTDIVSKYKKAIDNGEDIILEEDKLTYGHFYRGVE